MCYLADERTKQSKTAKKSNRGGCVAKRKPVALITAATNFRGTTMTTKSNIVKYLLLRTAAFVGLTAASTAVMALPYLA